MINRDNMLGGVSKASLKPFSDEQSIRQPMLKGFSNPEKWVLWRSGALDVAYNWLRNGEKTSLTPLNLPAHTLANIYIPEGVSLTLNANITINELYVYGDILFSGAYRILTVVKRVVITGRLIMQNSNQTLCLWTSDVYINKNKMSILSDSNLWIHQPYINSVNTFYPFVLKEFFVFQNLSLENARSTYLKVLGDININSFANRFSGSSYVIFDLNNNKDCIIQNLLFSNSTSVWLHKNDGKNIIIGFMEGTGWAFNIGNNSRVLCSQQMFAGVNNLMDNTSWVEFTSNANLVTNNSNVNYSNIQINDGVTVTRITTGVGTIIINNELIGVSGTSVFDNRGNLAIRFAHAPMLVGLFYCNQLNNNVNYNLNGGQEVKVPDDGQYKTLSFSGSGQKKLLGNIVCDILIIMDWATIDFNGFTLTVNNEIILEPNSSFTIPNTTNLIHSGIMRIRRNVPYLLSSNRTVSELIFDNGNPTINFAGYTLTSTTTRYIANQSQSVWGTVNQPLTNLEIGGTATPNNKTLQGDVHVHGTYTETGNAVRVDGPYTFTNP